MHAFILHLTRARARRENAHDLVETCGLPGEIWAAVDGRALDSGDLAWELTEGLLQPPYPFPLNPGEVGCFMSHRQIWAEILRRELTYALILEDDVELDHTVFEAALRLAVRHVDRLGYIQLQNRPVKGPVRLLDQDGPAKLCLPELAPHRTSAQLVSYDAAHRLLSCAEKIDRPVDAFVQAHWFTGLRPAAIFPSGVGMVSNEAAASTIQGRDRKAGATLQREFTRWRYRRQVARQAARSNASMPEEDSQP